jgi:hypothetical protein
MYLVYVPLSPYGKYFAWAKLLDRSLRGLLAPLPIKTSFRNHAAPRIYRVSFDLGSGPLPLRELVLLAGERCRAIRQRKVQYSTWSKDGKTGNWHPRTTLEIGCNPIWQGKLGSFYGEPRLLLRTWGGSPILKGHRLDKFDMARY